MPTVRPALVVDDCRINLLLVKHILGKIGVRVDCAGTGKEGLRLSSETDYPLIFLDIMLPDLDGLEICRQIRARPEGKNPRVVLLTAMGEQFSQARATEAGADEVVFKPIVPSRIAELGRRFCLNGGQDAGRLGGVGTGERTGESKVEREGQVESLPTTAAAGAT